ncbi:MAG: hypothetical protein DMF59_06985 [Acidobacteria bacterium]|nr:MAG: hypothetical protein DMF59_06985 [Acidobacteriota bacterium]
MSSTGAVAITVAVAVGAAAVGLAAIALEATARRIRLMIFRIMTGNTQGLSKGAQSMKPLFTPLGKY